MEAEALTRHTFKLFIKVTLENKDVSVTVSSNDKPRGEEEPKAQRIATPPGRDRRKTAQRKNMYYFICIEKHLRVTFGIHWELLQSRRDKYLSSLSSVMAAFCMTFGEDTAHMNRWLSTLPKSHVYFMLCYFLHNFIVSVIHVFIIMDQLN